MDSSSTYKFLPSRLADRLSNLTLTVKRPVEGALQGLHRSPHHGSSVEFAEYREYVPGDPPNRIDWAVYARNDRYVIRRFHEETNLRAYILLDTSESLAFREEGLYTKMDYASYLAAALMYIFVHQGDTAGLVTFDQSVQQFFPPVGTFTGLRPLLLGLEEIQSAGKSHIETALHEVAEMVHSRSLIILISDLLQDPAEILRGMQHLHHDGHDITVFHILDGAELELPFEGLEEFKELETGERLMIDVAEIADAYSFEVRKYLDEIRTGCMDCMADYHLIDTKFPVEEALYQRATRL